MAPVELVEQQAASYSSPQHGKERAIPPPESRSNSNQDDKRSSATYLTIPISTHPVATQHRRSWIRRYWIFVLAMAVLIVGGIIAGAVGEITASRQQNTRGPS
ncbi:uncharacterized protein LY79DRAFT_571552 [Colletotrichum navitas]|uniref:Uncharacterized protein n=1 Tax=Colletotrichum navitas TaxID=681940 RepID=A0AAD8PKW0_9PEZI|nr:uncharacterized protein LY79DRAFT_571552 [Colletotrichum navitas]KAK1569606.1 hypothetical protein LY79DRAFT_571552 [Colletotrichum navitas]